jgi:S1-C subfamily serine protease
MANLSKNITFLLLTCSLITPSLAADTRNFDESSEDYSGMESSYMETGQPSIDADDLQRLLKQLIGNKKEKASAIERLHKKMESYFPYVYKIGFGSSLTGESGGHTGTGFLLDAAEGIILTNYHVVPGNDFGIITLTDDDGNEYTEDDVEILSTSIGEQFGDFTFLRVKKLATDNPQAQMPLARVYDIKKHDHLGFVGNSYGNLAVETGQVSDRYSYWDRPEVIGSMSFSVNLKARGGASGSPVFDVNGTVVGILFAGDEVHNMIFPMPMVLNFYEQLKRGEKLSVRTLGAPLTSETIQDLARYHQIPLDDLKSYLTDGDEEQENKLMVAQPHTLPKDKESSLLSGDIVLEINGENVSPNQIRTNDLINQSEEAVVTVYRLGELKTLKIKPTVYTQEFAKSIDVDGTTIVSADSSLLDRYGVKSGTPLLKIPVPKKSEILYYYKIVSRVHRTEVTTFNDFVKAVHDTYVTAGLSTFMLWIKDSMSGSEESFNMDLRGAMGKSFFVTQMNEKTHRWENLSYEAYIKRAFPSIEATSSRTHKLRSEARKRGSNNSEPPAKRKKR